MQILDVCGWNITSFYNLLHKQIENCISLPAFVETVISSVRPNMKATVIKKIWSSPINPIWKPNQFLWREMVKLQY